MTCLSRRLGSVHPLILTMDFLATNLIIKTEGVKRVTIMTEGIRVETLITITIITIRITKEEIAGITETIIVIVVIEKDMTIRGHVSFGWSVGGVKTRIGVCILIPVDKYLIPVTAAQLKITAK